MPYEGKKTDRANWSEGNLFLVSENVKKMTMWENDNVTHPITGGILQANFAEI